MRTKKKTGWIQIRVEKELEEELTKASEASHLDKSSFVRIAVWDKIKKTKKTT